MQGWVVDAQGSAWGTDLLIAVRKRRAADLSNCRFFRYGDLIARTMTCARRVPVVACGACRQGGLISLRTNKFPSKTRLGM